jgi:hypothetical protein
MHSKILIYQLQQILVVKVHCYHDNFLRAKLLKHTRDAIGRTLSWIRWSLSAQQVYADPDSLSKR